MKEKRISTGIASLDPRIWEESSIKVIEKVLEQVLSRTGKELVFSLLKNNYGIEKEDLARKSEIFHKTLEEFFGRSGMVIESMIVQKIKYKEIKLKKR